MTVRWPTIAGALIALLPTSLLAQGGGKNDSYPVRPIRLLIPYSPGGASDNIARIVMPKLGESLKQSIVIDNRPGGAGSLGRDLVAKGVPDGYTLLSTDAPHSINPYFMKLPYDALKDFTPISMTATAPMIMIVNPTLPVKTVGDLVALAKAQPGKLNFGSGGNGAITHLTGELFKVAANINIVHVPYKSIAPAVTDLMGNQIPIAFPGFATVGGHIRAGRVRLLAVAATKRAAAFPDAPTFEESGVPGVIASNWFGIMGPPKLPRAIVDKLNAEIHKALRHPEVVERLTVSSIEPLPTTPQEFQKHIEAEYARWGKVIKAAGIKPE